MTGAIQGTSADKINRQARFMARCVEDPSKLGVILPVGFGDMGGGGNILDDKLAGEGNDRR